MNRLKHGILAFAALICSGLVAAPATASPLPEPLQVTQGGAGGRIIRVTSLAAEGPGTLREAVAAQGPRIIVFEIGGVIDLGRSSIDIREGQVTIAGETAPGPGITIIRGGIDIRTHDVILSHIRVYTGADGQPQRSGWEADALSTVAARNVIIRNCSFLWGVDENMSASGPRFTGTTLDQWRAGTSRNIVFANNLAAEGLANASHPKGEHSKGSLVHDNATGITFYRNVWAHNVERHPLVKGGAQVLMVNNLIYNPGHRAVQYNLMALEWVGQDYVAGELTTVGNVMRGGNDTNDGLPFLMLGGDGDLGWHDRDTIAVDRHGQPLPLFGRYGETRARIIRRSRPHVPLAGIPVLPARDVETAVLASAGARPWARSPDDIRVLFFIAEGRGEIIDDEREVSGYPVIEPVRAPFVEADWDLATMTPRSGLYPAQTAPSPQEHLTPRDRSSRGGA
jgi:pectate lyase